MNNCIICLNNDLKRLYVLWHIDLLIYIYQACLSCCSERIRETAISTNININGKETITVALWSVLSPPRKSKVMGVIVNANAQNTRCHLAGCSFAVKFLVAPDASV